MDLMRYPLGQFEVVEHPTQEQRDNWIAEIAEFPKSLQRAVQNMTLEQLNTPYRPGGWTVQQVVHHVADNDMNAYIRFKKALTEESPLAGTFNEVLWAELADYKQTPVETSLIFMEALHNRFVILLRSLQFADFDKTFSSPTHGLMTLNTATQRYAWHNRHHLAQITSLKFESKLS